MKAPNLHLNLLHASERQSSSPVRLRVMLPIFAVLACVGCLVWWGVLACQLILVKSQAASIQKDLAAKNAEHGDILQQMGEARNAQAELDQLTMYAHGRRTYGTLFKNLAEAVPEELQLLSLEIPEPPVQNLLPPGAKPGPKVKPLLGPTNTVEGVALRILGRTVKETPVESLMKALEGPAFTNVLVIAKDVPADQASPRIRSFQQETTPNDSGLRLLVFDVEYRCAERSFEK
jgi:Tfp pilus assembly protein PilN